MPKCRSPPFFCLKNSQSKEMEEFKMKKEYYLYVGGQKNHLLFFSFLDQDGHFTENIIDESVDVEKIVGSNFPYIK